MASIKIEPEEQSAITEDNASEHPAGNKRLSWRMSPEHQRLATQIGKVCRSARKGLSLTQEQVGDLLEINGEFYARIERGRALPSVTLLVKIAKTLGISADDILGTDKGRKTRSANPAAQDPPELKRILRYVHKAKPSTIRIVTVMIKELERDAHPGTRKITRTKSQ